MKSCPKCGAELADDAVFCSSCGASLAVTEPTVPETPVAEVSAVQSEVKTEEGITDNASPKSRLAVTLMAWLGGTVGVHNFYSGRPGSGVGKIIISLVSWIFYFIGLGCIIGGEEEAGAALVALFVFIYMGVAVWALVEAILCTCGKYADKDGKDISVWIHE